MKTEGFPQAGVFLATIVVCWLAPGVVFLTSGSDKAAFLTASVTCALAGLVFLLLCLPLARLMEHSKDLVRRSSWGMRLLFHVGLPTSKPGWIVANVLMASFFFCTSVIMFYTATGKPEPEFVRWLEKLFR